MDPAHDVFAVGVMAYEAICHARCAFRLEYIAACAAGDEWYPWELPLRRQPPVWQSSRLRPLLEPCLRRDDAARPSAAALVQSVGRIGQTTLPHAPASDATSPPHNAVQAAETAGAAHTRCGKGKLEAGRAPPEQRGPIVTV